MFRYIFQLLLMSFKRSKSFRKNLTFFFIILKFLIGPKGKHKYLYCYRLLSFSIYSTGSLSAFYIFIANMQPEGGEEELGHLETEVNGEFHGFFIRFYCMADILLIWGKTLSNLSVIFS